MSQPTASTTNRREFLHNTGRVAAATSLATMMVPKVHAAEDSTIRIALVGCGGRGTGAARDALSVEQQGLIKLTAWQDARGLAIRVGDNGIATE